MQREYFWYVYSVQNKLMFLHDDGTWKRTPQLFEEYMTAWDLAMKYSNGIEFYKDGGGIAYCIINPAVQQVYTRKDNP